MLAEVQEAKQWFNENYIDKGLTPPPGSYAIPTYSSKGKGFMRVIIDERKYMSSFEMFWDKEFKLPYYEHPNPNLLKRLFHNLTELIIKLF